MAHKHSVYDTDPHFQIDGVTRVVKNASNTKTTLVQYDHNSERFTFEIPRMVDGHDMKLANQVQVHYINIDSSDRTGQTKSSGVYEVNDLQTSPNGDDVVICSWLISRNATKYVGNLSFTIRFACIADDGTEDYAWNTAIHSAVYVSAGIYNGEEVTDEEAYVDIIAQWKADLFGVGDTEEQRLLDVSAQQQAAIEAKGATVLASIPDEYEELSNKVNEYYGKAASSIVCNVGGERISVSDASDDGFRGLKLFGKTTQFTTTGKNFAMLYNGNTYENNGGTVTIEADGTVVVNGTVTANTSFYIGKYAFDGRCILTLDVLSGTLNNTYVNVKDKNGSTIGTNYGNCQEFDGATTEQNVTLVVRAGTYTNLRMQIMIRPASISDATYEPYTGGIPAPNPDFPQELVSVGASGAINTTVCGKNLLAYPYYFTSLSLAGVEVSVDKSQVINISGTSTGTIDRKLNDLALPVGTYTLNHIQSGENTRVYVKKNGTTVKSIAKADRSYTFTIEDTADVWSVNIGCLNGKSFNDTVMVMVEVGNTATAYELYNAQTLTAQTPNGLPGIPVASGGNYTDANGQQWICDGIDFAKGVYVQRIGHDVLCGDEPWKMSTTDYGSVTYFYAAYSDMIKTNGDNNGGVISDRFIESYGINTIEHIRVHGSAGQLMLFITTSRLSDVSVDGLKAWFAENNTTLMYRLENPIETPLSAEELAQYAALHTNKPNTTVYNDAGAYMEMEYNADTKLYIDNKFAELAAMIAASTAQSTAQIAE